MWRVSIKLTIYTFKDLPHSNYTFKDLPHLNKYFNKLNLTCLTFTRQRLIIFTRLRLISTKTKIIIVILVP